MKRKYLYLLFLLVLLIPCPVLAGSSVIISCDSDHISSDILECSIIANVDEGVSYNRVESNLSIPSSGSASFVNSPNFQGLIQNNHLTIKSESNVGSINLGTIKIKLSSLLTGTFEIKLSDIKFFDNDKEVSNVANANSIVKLASTSNSLESLTIDNCNDCKLSPNFDKDTTIYTVTTTSSKIVINAKASGNATVTGTGEKTLTKEKETFNIVVTSESGDVKTYRIIVNKKSSKSTDNSLKSLSIEGAELSPILSNNVTTYRATVDLEKIVIKGEVSDSKATVVGLGEKTLAIGENKFDIIVTAEDGSSRTYTVIVTRNDTKSDVFLDSLTINGEKINLKENTFEYTYTLKEDLSSLKIDTKQKDNLKVEVKGNENLKEGENIITITVTGEKDVKTTYTVKVMKELSKEEEEGLYLSGLTIEGYDIDFDKEKLDYTITIKDEKKLNIVALTNNDDYTVEVTGNEDLKDGSIIKIIVTDVSGDSNIYTINIKVAPLNETVPTTNNSDINDINYIPIIMTGLLALLAIIDLVLLIKRIKNK